MTGRELVVSAQVLSAAVVVEPDGCSLKKKVIYSTVVNLHFLDSSTCSPQRNLSAAQSAANSRGSWRSLSVDSTPIAKHQPQNSVDYSLYRTL